VGWDFPHQSRPAL